MCSISGFINFSGTDKNLTIRQKQTDIILKGEARGRDSFGVYTLFTNGDEELKRFLGSPKDCKEIISKEDERIPLVILNNNRAEPTTEFIEHKTEKDTQPFRSKNVICVHNGIIANDKELKEKYNIVTETTIDSEVLPHLIEQCNTDEEVRDLLVNEIKGSFALAAFNKKTNKFYLATNYKPLFIMSDKHKNLYFSSMPEYLNSNYKTNYQNNIPVELEPYSMVVFDINEGFDTAKNYSLYPTSFKQKKALIIASSGLDSTVAASWAKFSGFDITLLHFHYDAIAEEKEKEQIKLIAEKLEAPLYFIPINFYKDIIGGSNLYNGGEINKSNSGESGTELAFEWVPARNLVFFSIATAFAEAHDIDYIILGGNLEESGCVLNVKENKIRMFDGSKKMPKDIVVGDELLSWNFDNKRVEKTIVEKVFTPKKDFYYELVLEGRKFKNRKDEEVRLKVSSEHPFWIKNKGWVETKDLNVGDVLMKFSDVKQSELQSNPNTNNGAFKKGNLVGEKNKMFGHIRSDDKVCWCGEIHKINIPKIQETLDLLKNDPEFIKKVSDGVKKYYKTQTTEQKEIHSNNTKEGLRKARVKYKEKTGYSHWNQQEEVRKKLSESMYKLIDEGKINPANNTKRPTKCESKFINFFEKYNIPFEYKGDGQIWITGNGKRMNPDFVNLEKKKIVEVTTRDFPFHNENEFNTRKENFKSVGWEMMNVYDTDLENELEAKATFEMFLSGELQNGLTIKDIILHKEEVQTYNYYCYPNNNFFIGNSGVLTHNSYPDNEQIFQRKFNDLLPNAVGYNKKIEVLAPLSTLMKKEIVELGFAVNAPLDLTWSCYDNGELHCGECGPCYMRKTAFKMAGKEEVIKYLND